MGGAHVGSETQASIAPLHVDSETQVLMWAVRRRPVVHARKISISVAAWRTAETAVVSAEPGISMDRFSTHTSKVTVSPNSTAAELHALSWHTDMDGLIDALHIDCASVNEVSSETS